MSKEKFTRGNKIIKSKLFFPGVYVACLAFVLIGAFTLQHVTKGSDESVLTDLTMNNVSDAVLGGVSDNASEEVSKVTVSNQDQVVVKRPDESFAMPLTDSDSVVIKKQFYDVASDEVAQESALLKHDTTYQLSSGIDYAMNDDSSFDVIAAMSGVVTRVQNDAFLGNVVEVEHADGIVSQYSSVSDIAVNVGDTVEQGQQLAKAATSEINPDSGVHMHFEIRKNGVAVNPTDYLQKPLSALSEANVTNGMETIKSEGTSEVSGQSGDSTSGSAE